MKPKSIDRLEEKMKEVEVGSLRYRILDNAKNFKSSWVELGRALYSVYKDKMYKEWGYGTFDIYTSKEIGIKKQTALKLLRSYYFLEKEEPQYLSKQFLDEAEAAKVPSYESVDVLRQAKNKKILDDEDYTRIKKEIFEDGVDFAKARKDLTALIRERKELDPQEAQEAKRISTLRKLLGTLKAVKKEAEILKLLPATLLKQTSELISKIEEEVS
jgi:hypothetical protein